MSSDVDLSTLLRDIEIRLHPGTSDDQECEGEKTYGGRHRIGRVLRSYSVAIRELPPIVNVVLPLELGDGGLDHVQMGEVNFDPVEPRKKAPTILTDDPLEKRYTPSIWHRPEMVIDHRFANAAFAPTPLLTPR